LRRPLAFDSEFAEVSGPGGHRIAVAATLQLAVGSGSDGGGSAGQCWVVDTRPAAELVDVKVASAVAAAAARSSSAESFARAVATANPSEREAGSEDADEDADAMYRRQLGALLEWAWEHFTPVREKQKLADEVKSITYIL
jgi:hypothetical protein